MSLGLTQRLRLKHRLGKTHRTQDSDTNAGRRSEKEEGEEEE